MNKNLLEDLLALLGLAIGTIIILGIVVLAWTIL